MKSETRHWFSLSMISTGKHTNILTTPILITLVFRFSKHDQIGQVLLALGKIDLGQVIEEWKDIMPPPDDKEAEKNLGDICFSLR
jgi:hypothetical protein